MELVLITNTKESPVPTIPSSSSQKEFFTVSLSNVSSKTDNELVLTLASKSRSILLVNEGVDNVRVGLGNSSLGAFKDNDNVAFTYTGTFTNGTAFYGSVGAKSSLVTDDYAVFNPGVSNVASISLGTTLAGGGGIMGLKLSLDGVTWSDPSTILGVRRSDGAVSTAMNTLDLYGTLKGKIIRFDMPYPATWRLKVIVTGTKNALSSSNRIYVDGGWHTTSEVTDLKGGDDMTLDVAVETIALFVDANSAVVRVMVTE